MINKPTGAQIRQEFIDFFVEKHGHTFVPSASLVPGGDATLLFTNAGMVQFKDVFLGTDNRPYARAVNSQKCMRVAGKHNDLDDVGRDDTHHTFFEMLGNWSFGDYYKQEAIAWAWELLTEVWGLPKANIWATCFKDDQGQISTDTEAAEAWVQQPGMNPDQILYFGRKDNFWEMAETGPCGPCSEIHFDRGPEYCNMQPIPGHICKVNGECTRFLELWNLVFIQYNRHSPTHLEPLPNKHVDTGMGFERIVSVLQEVDSNYKTDLLAPLLKVVQNLTGHSDKKRQENLTPYRVIADHARAASFLIADGVVPGNMGRNYICRMIIRRAARFGGNIGLNEPFMARVAEVVVRNYGDFYPELKRNRKAILDSITREETRFQRTLESGMAKLEELMSALRVGAENTLSGDQAFDLYATFGLPLEITRDIARENGFKVDESGFHKALEAHRLASGAGETFGAIDEGGVEFYRQVLTRLQSDGLLGPQGVIYDPYEYLEVESPILALIRAEKTVNEARPGDHIEIILSQTGFYVESGGQVSDTGTIKSVNPPEWEIQITEARRPTAGMIVHIGEVTRGAPRQGDTAIAQVDFERRVDIMRNHTATHLLHAELRAVLGEHARQAGSLVAPDRLRFDFTHPEAVTPAQLEQIEAGVNHAILGDYRLNIEYKPLQEAIAGGAIALFGEKYGTEVRNITIGGTEPFSNELCGGTHVEETGDIGLFLITSEGSAAAGIRRIEAITGRRAYEYTHQRLSTLGKTAALLGTRPEDVLEKTAGLINEQTSLRKELVNLRRELTAVEFHQQLTEAPLINGIPVLTMVLPDADVDTLRQMSDEFRAQNPSGVAVLATVQDGKPLMIACVTEDLVPRGLHAGHLVKHVAQLLGGGGGGKPTLAQAGGRESEKLPEALDTVQDWVVEHLA